MERWGKFPSSSGYDVSSSESGEEARKSFGQCENLMDGRCMPWSLTRENPACSGVCDQHTIEIALKKKDRKGKLEIVMERQLKGRFFREKHPMLFY